MEAWLYRLALALSLSCELILPQSGSKAENSRGADGGDHADSLRHFISNDQKEVADLRNTIEQATERLEKSPSDVVALSARGNAYLLLGDFEQAGSDLAALVKLTPADPTAWRSYGSALRHSGHYKKALACYEKALQLGIEDPIAIYEHGEVLVQLGSFSRATDILSRALELDPSFVEAIGLRAECFVKLDKWQEAIALCDRIIELQPKHSYGYGLRGTTYLAHQEIAKGTADVWRAIRLNSDDAGCNYRLVANENLSAESLAHGEKQVRQMLRDRPTMAKYVNPGDRIWTWAVRKFAGEDLGAPIDWDPASPGHLLGISFAATGNQHAKIQIADLYENLPNSPSRTFDDLWATAVFELHNVAGSDGWQERDEEAKNGSLSEITYIRASFTGEERAMQQTRAFYLECYLPWLQSKQLTTTAANTWYCDWFPPSDFAKEAQWRKMSAWPICVTKYKLLRGQGEYERANYEQAIGHFTETLAVSLNSPESNEARFMRGLAFLLSGDPQHAVEDFSKLLKVPDYAAHAYLWRGVAWQMLEQFDKSLSDFNEAVRLAPDLADAYYRRAPELIRRGEEDKGLDDLAEAIRLDPENPELLWYRGTIWLRKDEYPRAAEDYSAAIKLDPEYAAPYLGRGYCWSSQGELAKALNDYNRAIELAPEYYDNYIYRAETFNKQGNYDAAVKDLNRAIELDPQNSEAYECRANLWAKKERYAKALDDFSKAIELDSENSEIYASRAELFLKSKDPKYFQPAQAVSDATKSCELTSWKSADKLSLLAAAHDAQGNINQAIKWQTEAVESSNEKDKNRFKTKLKSYISAKENTE